MKTKSVDDIMTEIILLCVIHSNIIKSYGLISLSNDPVITRTLTEYYEISKLDFEKKQSKLRKYLESRLK